MTAETLIRPDGTALVYERFTPEKVGAKASVLFMHGFRSDRNATKAQFLDTACRRHGIPFLRYDAYAHGESGGEWADFTISRAVHDALLVLDERTEGPQIVVGSSMGGWVALRLMEERPERVAGIVGIATAPDFTQKIAAPTADYTQALMDDGPNNFVMGEDWTFTGPVHLLQGQQDDSVPWEWAPRIAAKFGNPDQVRLTLVPDGDHRLNRPQDLELQERAILDVLARI